MRIRLYGRLGDAIGQETDVDSPEGSTVAEIRHLLVATHPSAIGPLARARACMNDRLVGDDQRLSPHDILEFLPPVSGG